MWRTLLAPLLLLFSLVAAAQESATCSFTFFQIPGVSRTLPHGINRYGNVVGIVVTADDQQRGFIRYVGGGFKTWLAPDSLETSFYRRNANGWTVGSYRDAANRLHGLGFFNEGTYTLEVDFPGAIHTEVLGINQYGSNAGYYVDGTGHHGFRTKDGKFIKVDYPGAVATQVEAISDTGVIVGWFRATISSHPRAFVLKNGIYTAYDHPQGTNGTVFMDINASGTIVGVYYPGQSTGGFIFKDGVYKNVVVDGSSYTTANGINGYGIITGEARLPSGPKGYTASCQ